MARSSSRPVPKDGRSGRQRAAARHVIIIAHYNYCKRSRHRISSQHRANSPKAIHWRVYEFTASL